MMLHTYTPNHCPYQVYINSFRDIARTRFYWSRSLWQGQIKVAHITHLHTLTNVAIKYQHPTHYCLASEVRHPSEVRHLRFMTILKSFYTVQLWHICTYTLPLKEDIPFI